MNLLYQTDASHDAPSSAAPDAAAGSIPVTLLTGFLGAGKTTLVNHILRRAHGLKIAVLVNEFGSLGVDGQLIVGAAGPVVELPNGCVCCATGDDLLRSLDAMLSRPDRLDGVLIETSGLANPGPVVSALEQCNFSRAVRLAGVVTVVDAPNFDANLERAEAAFQQLVAADLLLINKCDLVGPDVPAAIAAGVAKLNPNARAIQCTQGDVALELIFDMAHATPAAPMDCRAAPHAAFESIAVWVPGALHAERFGAWLDQLPASIFRAKGLLRFAGHTDMFAFHLVGTRHAVESMPGIDRAFCALTLIGKNIARLDLQSSFSQCAATRLEALHEQY